MDKKGTKEMEKAVNRLTLIVIAIIDMFFFAGYISDFKQGNISFAFMMAVEVTVFLTLLASTIVFFHKQDSEVFKYVSLIGYMVVYTLVLFGAQNNSVFAVIFPIALIYLLYYNYKLILGAVIGFSVINIADIVYYAGVLKHMPDGGAVNSTSVLLQAACVEVFLIVLAQTTKLSNDNNARKIVSLNEEKEKSAQLLKDVLVVVENVKNNSAEAEDYIKDLGKDVERTAATLGDISEGNNNNARNIEQQTMMTGSIQEIIVGTKKMADEMLTLARESGEAVDGGRDSMGELLTQSGETKAANEEVVAAVTRLIENAKAVENITEQIFSISGQTNLLALNASIESARAGEAGRGFAVVADEIRALADQTRKLTEEIQSVVSDLQHNADTAKNTVDNVMATAGTEHELINHANEQFSGIGSRMTRLNETVEETYRKIEEILQSNNTIVESIHQISAVSQEVAASTQQVVELGEDTRQKAVNAQKLMEDLNNTVKIADKYL